ncbi:hypothetical protein [Paenibacillus sp. sgz302251]
MAKKLTGNGMWESISKAVGDSLSHRKEIRVQLYHPLEELTVQGFMVDGE